jgi:hypothetical protein
MRHRAHLRFVLVACVFWGASSALAASGPTAAPEAKKPPEERLEVPPPPFSDGIFPCSGCHASQKPNPARRKLDFHEDIDLKHDAEHRWCLDCHDMNDRDVLHLASGEKVPFEESYRLCGQCHGDKLRDWKVGVHGRRTGEWNGHKKYLLCANCHNPHQPRFKALVPKPVPIRPTRPGQPSVKEPKPAEKPVEKGAVR